MRYAFFVVLAAMILSQSTGLFVDESVAREALENQGFTKVTVTERIWFFPSLRGCGSGDAARFNATATNPIGKPVQVYVCSGWLFKGSTVRS